MAHYSWKRFRFDRPANLFFNPPIYYKLRLKLKNFDPKRRRAICGLNDIPLQSGTDPEKIIWLSVNMPFKTRGHDLYK